MLYDREKIGFNSHFWMLTPQSFSLRTVQSKRVGSEGSGGESELNGGFRCTFPRPNSLLVASFCIVVPNKDVESNPAIVYFRLRQKQQMIIFVVIFGPFSVTLPLYCHDTILCERKRRTKLGDWHADLFPPSFSRDRPPKNVLQ